MLVTDTLTLKQSGITDIEIHFLQIKFTAIGVYINLEDILPHIKNWKGKTGDELAQDDDFFDALVTGIQNLIHFNIYIDFESFWIKLIKSI